jgi:hypothetical protein
MIQGLSLRPSGLLACCGLLPGLLAAIAPVRADEKKEPAAAGDTPASVKPVEEDKDGWRPLFNGKDLEGWKITNFGGEGEVTIDDGDVVILQGADLSGIHTDQELPKSNYEVQFEAMRQVGNDFFAGLTFPVGDSFCSLIVGGWGGGVCGLSSLNGNDASENETTSYQQFEKGKWYKIRLEVRDDHINAWIDDQQIVDTDIAGKRISLRFEVERSKPFGFSTWQTSARLRNVRIRNLPSAAADKPAGEGNKSKAGDGK